MQLSSLTITVQHSAAVVHFEVTWTPLIGLSLLFFCALDHGTAAMPTCSARKGRTGMTLKEILGNWIPSLILVVEEYIVMECVCVCVREREREV